ncbi:zinc dependent phospholipase C family protein [Mongoliitalea lutea]|uniref:S1/P1 Nuclease n=1 Tax=Mongoliitalea lutea TaxID=849756 RepID=A0A8J3G5P1_9BACT|nr:zinc dependent phospholipase C family protein [Mongoliitalea lutea]GHB41378.1 hypothetical protein GCM10008106_23130 [Mongoliitalea lutea]
MSDRWKRKLIQVILLVLLLVSVGECYAWGFFAHRRINRQAVFSLPPEMFGFFKYHIDYITDNAINPDRRRYAVLGEAEKHYIDVEAYGDSALYKLPRYWHQALEVYEESHLRAHGIGPWNVYHVKLQLTNAFLKKDKKAILRLAADLGHYIADMHVPLHTTQNYNGQLTNQHGIHAFWESRIPELLVDEYDFFVGQAMYIERPQLAIWSAVEGAHAALDSVLRFERELTARFDKDKKFTYEERGGINTRLHSRPFTLAYHELLDGQVERQMRAAIKLVADFWYTAWIDAGQPVLGDLLDIKEQLPEEKFDTKDPLPVREHEGLVLSLNALNWRKGREDIG